MLLFVPTEQGHLKDTSHCFIFYVQTHLCCGCGLSMCYGVMSDYFITIIVFLFTESRSWPRWCKCTASCIVFLVLLIIILLLVFYYSIISILL